MKQYLALALALLMLVSLCACGAKTVTDETVPASDITAESQPAKVGFISFTDKNAAAQFFPDIFQVIFHDASDIAL